MNHKETERSLETLLEIRSIMERSARFLSLSGWSGVWAGCVALAGAYTAGLWLDASSLDGNYGLPEATSIVTVSENIPFSLLLLALIVFIVALAGGYFFTWRKVRKQGGVLWNSASRAMFRAMAIPMVAGGVFCICFLLKGDAGYVAPACLIFYGLALYNGSKYTLSEIRYLGLLEIVLGCVCLFMPGYGLYFWAAGFGVLHILYGIVMWSRYDKQIGS